jgi:hypothetical protein
MLGVGNKLLAFTYVDHFRLQIFSESDQVSHEKGTMHA